MPLPVAFDCSVLKNSMGGWLLEPIRVRAWSELISWGSFAAVVFPLKAHLIRSHATRGGGRAVYFQEEYSEGLVDWQKAVCFHRSEEKDGYTATPRSSRSTISKRT